MKQDTKQKIIETGAHIMHQKGYNHTGIQEVLKAAGVPKGSFYFYFSSKEEFGLQVIDFFDNMYLDMVKSIIGDTTRAPLKRLAKILDLFIDLFRGLDYTCGCPIGNFSQEMGDLSPAFGDRLSKSVEVIVKIYRDLLNEAKDTQEIQEDIDTDEMADFIVSSWHGSLIRMKIVKSTQPLELHKRLVLRMLPPPNI